MENEIDQTEHVEIDVSGDLLHCTVGLYEFFMAHGKDGAAAFRVYFHLLYTYRRQKDIIRGTQILATTDYIAKGLGMGYSTVTAAKKFLESHGLIKLITKRDNNNRITGHYIRLILTSEPSRLLKENMETDYIAQNHIPESQGVETSNQIREVENLNTGGRNTGELSVYTAVDEEFADRPPPLPKEVEEPFLDLLKKHGTAAIVKAYRTWLESKIKARGQFPRHAWFLEVPITKEVVRNALDAIPNDRYKPPDISETERQEAFQKMHEMRLKIIPADFISRLAETKAVS